MEQKLLKVIEERDVLKTEVVRLQRQVHTHTHTPRTLKVYARHCRSSHFIQGREKVLSA
jgi:hypothetical protein